ncbi:MAG: hypothetical protein PUH24_08475 [Prevotellaceae bacterium]|nr:hypothetical protein [Prevotella sp.]MDD7258283.1 hypothetical protein [Prevotellaceae bacterium]MDY6129952.1 hypothetical protein [Prevotella sp.]
MGKRNNYILTFCILAVAAVCYLSITAPIRFQEKQKEREILVKQRLLKIRKAEQAYKRMHGTYTGDFKTLIASGLLADSLQYIPFSDKKKFELKADVKMMESGKQQPLMECAAPFEDYLTGLDENQIVNLSEKEYQAGRYPGLKIGDITTPNDNAGNWE